jgi:hypothetical protein
MRSASTGVLHTDVGQRPTGSGKVVKGSLWDMSASMLRASGARVPVPATAGTPDRRDSDEPRPRQPPRGRATLLLVEATCSEERTGHDP